MDKTIENKLFTEFETGAAALCLDYVMEVVVNNWEHLPPNSQKWRKVYNDIPTRVAELTEAFDDVAWPINIKGHYRIAQEISDNLDNCINDNERERYICNILQVFEEWAKAFTPISQIHTIEPTLKKSREGLAFQTEEEIRTALDRIKGMHDRLLEIMDNAKEGSIEAYFHHWYHAYYDFCNMFAAICVEHGINLLEIQNRRGIWLVDKLDVMQIQFYFGYDGNCNYANSLLKALPRTSATEALILTEKDGVINTEAVWNNRCSTFQLPNELATNKALKYFPIAIDNGVITITENGYLWNESTALLDLFCGMIYCNDEIRKEMYTYVWHLGVGEFPSSALNKVFLNKKNIGQQRVNNLIKQTKCKRYRSAPKKWRDIVNLFD